MTIEKSNNVQSSGVGFFGLLGIVFIILKITGYVGWSWWLVTAPLWGPTVLVLTIFLIILIGAGIINVFSK